MKLFRARSANVVEYLEPHLIEDEQSPNQVAEYLRNLLRNFPENIYIVAAFEDTEEGEALLRGFMVAVDEGPARGFTFILQAWQDKGVPKELSGQMFFHILNWVTLLGKRYIRMETMRNSEAFARRWNFEEYSRIMQFHIPEDYESMVIDHSVLVGRKDSKDGQVVEASSDEGGAVPVSVQTSVRDSGEPDKSGSGESTG